MAKAARVTGPVPQPAPVDYWDSEHGKARKRTAELSYASRVKGDYPRAQYWWNQMNEHRAALGEPPVAFAVPRREGEPDPFPPPWVGPLRARVEVNVHVGDEVVKFDLSLHPLLSAFTDHTRDGSLEMAAQLLREIADDVEQMMTPATESEAQ